jgi:hypothetical protein
MGQIVLDLKACSVDFTLDDVTVTKVYRSGRELANRVREGMYSFILTDKNVADSMLIY